MIRIEDLALSILTKTTVIPEFKSKDGDLNENYAHQGIGEQILQYVKALFAFALWKPLKSSPKVFHFNQR